MAREIHTKRLLLRQWTPKDHELMAAINADPEVMEFYPSCQTREQSLKMTNYMEGLIAEQGWGFWAVETKYDQQFIGFVGLHQPHYDLPVKPCIEVGWRLKKQAWGKGYAPEAAKEALNFAFTQLKLDCVYSFTSVINMRSISVMEKIGMVNMNRNFDHPMVADSHKLKEHVLYKIEAN